jgi:hypothetical protein
MKEGDEIDAWVEGEYQRFMEERVGLGSGGKRRDRGLKENRMVGNSP